MPTRFKTLSQKQTRLKFLLNATVSCILMLAALVIYEQYSFDVAQEKEVIEVTKTLAEQRSELEFIINNNLNLTKGLTTYISLNPDLTQDMFAQYVAQLLADKHLIRNIGAAKDLVVTHVYPLEGNEAALGLSYLDSPTQKAAALKALEVNKTILAGPLHLVQGDTALIARQPITNAQTGEPWGILSTVINHRQLFELAGLYQESSLKMTIQGKDALGENGEFFYGEPNILSQSPVKLSVKLPYGEWVLYGIPQFGWPSFTPNYGLWASALLLLSLWLSSLFYRYRSERMELDSLQSMFESERKFRKIFHNHNAMMLLIEKETGRIVDANQAALDFYGYTHSQLTSKTIYDVNALNKEQIQSEMQQAADLKKNFFVFPHRLSNGKTRIVEVHSTPMVLDGKASLFSILHDITERIEVEQKLKLDAKVFEHSQEGVLMTDANNRIISVNNAFSDITGYTPEEVINKDPSLLRSGRHDAPFYKHMYDAIDREGYWKGEIWNRKKDGTIYPQLLSISKVENDAKQITHYVAVFSDITRLKQSEARMQQLAHYDALTRLPNRLLLLSRIEHAAEKSRRYPELRTAVLFLDLDHFKIVNDSLGHAAGDELLRLVAKRLKAQVREEDTVARLGGDEFAILLEGIKEVESLTTIAQNIIETVKLPYTLNAGQEVVIGTSIGIALYPDDTPETNRLLTCSDAAMYKAKHNGRNTFAFYTQSITTEAENKLKRINELRRALENNELELYFQPQVSFQSLKIIGAEALIRWNHPVEGVLAPVAFISIAEETGIIHEISKWVIAKGCEQLSHWQKKGQKITLSLNVSPKDFRYDDLHQLVAEQLDHHQIDPTLLELELTENGLMETSGQVMELLRQLKSLGISLAVDDFGTGHSSISYLKHFPVDKLKIDRSFVMDVVDDLSDKMITETIVDMAKNFNLVVVAEGVETEAQQNLLRDLGCHVAQGYLYSKPIPIEQFDKLLNASHFSFEM